MKIIKELTDLKYLTWSKMRESSGIAGSYLKSYSYSNGKKIYYKLSFFDDINGLFGYDAFNEIIAARIMEQLNISHLDYYLIHGTILINEKEYNTYLNYSYDFKKNTETKVTFENFFNLNKLSNETIIEFSKRYNFLDDIYNIIIVDFLIMNRDRHGANIEVLVDKRNKEYRIAPLFDHGLSFLSPNYLEKDILDFDVTLDRKVNSFIGTSDLKKNLELVPLDKLPHGKLNLEYIFSDLSDILPYEYIDKCKQIIKNRWDYIENLQNKK